MLKKIKIIQDFMDHNNVNRNGEEFDAIVVEDNDGNLSANIDVGAPYSYRISNSKGLDPWFMIAADSDAYSTANLKEELDLVSKQRDEISDEAQDLVTDLAAALKERDELIDKLEKTSEEIERDHIKTGYVVIPAKYLDKEMADEFKNHLELIISPKELVAMCTSAQMEINKGDTRESSLNVKLYTIMSDFAEDEIDKMIESGKTA